MLLTLWSLQVIVRSSCRRATRSELPRTKTRIFARVGDTSTEPHHRFELANGWGEASRSVGKHWSRGQICSLRSCLGVACGGGVAKSALRVCFFGEAIAKHRLRDGGNTRRSECAMHYAPSSLLLLYSWSPKHDNITASHYQPSTLFTTSS